MKHYIVYVDGVEVDMIQAPNHNAAEKKAKRMYQVVTQGYWGEKRNDVSVVYTEI